MPLYTWVVVALVDQHQVGHQWPQEELKLLKLSTESVTKFILLPLQEHLLSLLAVL
jgi:hypothetical protein